MRRFAASILIGSALTAAPATAHDHCPPDKLGPNYPWFTEEIMRGDMYSEVFLDVDREGNPTGCSVGKNNVTRDQEYRACAVYLRGWQMTPPPPPGTRFPIVVRRLFLLRGGTHIRAERAARAAYFAQHPELRPECYPKDY
jgi:hypothetical protein